MIRNYLILAIKNLRKQKGFSIINILGLTVGISCCLLIFLFIVNELSYDNFHKNGKNIYRIMRTGNINGDRREIPYVSPPYAPALVNDFPGMVEQAVRVMPDNDLITYNDISFNEKKVYLADENFFKVFDFQLLRGDPSKVLKNPNSIILTATTAKKYFGEQDPLGKVVKFNNQQQLIVTGIAADVPANSHLQFDIIIPFEILRSIQPEWFNQWPNNGMFTYIRLKQGIEPSRLEKLLPAFMEKYLGSYYAETGHKMGLIMKPLDQVYFSSNAFDNVKHGNKKMVYIFMSIAILILVIACINFLNLATARATDRSKEVGLRKVLGAVRKQLIFQFILESVLFATVACLLSVLLVLLIMPAYSGFLGYKLPAFWNYAYFYFFVAGIILFVGIVAGSYPAFLLSSFSPIESLKGKLRVGRGGAFFRKALVVFQFGISVLLIICVIVINSQLSYLQNTNLGFNKEQEMIVRLDNLAISHNKIQFKNRIAGLQGVKSVSLMSGEPGGFHDSYSFEAEGKPGEKMMFNTEFTDLDFVKTLGLKVIAGRDLSESFGTDTSSSVLINRTAALKLGYTPEQAIGKWVRNINRDSINRTIVGVVEDYHYASLKDPIGPLVISPGTDKRLALIKLQTQHLSSTIESISRIYVDEAPAYPFEYSFLDEKFNQLYKTEIRQGSVLSIFSIIAIFIACLGLFGLASYTAVKRTKEIGVRKVLGSSVKNIVLLLSTDLLKPVLVGTVIAVPAGYYAMNRWLENFAYRIEFHWWMFFIAVFTSVMIAMVTVSFQAIKAAVANPMKSLRTE